MAHGVPRNFLLSAEHQHFDALERHVWRCTFLQQETGCTTVDPFVLGRGQAHHDQD